MAISVAMAALVVHFGIAGRPGWRVDRAAVGGVAAVSGPPVGAAPLVVVIQARRPSWVSAAIDGGQPTAHKLGVGERQRFGARRDVLLRVGDGAAVSWTVNGAEGRPFGAGGEAATAHLTLDNFMSYRSIR
ncbi:MAG: DUF4115 domain-containing protein [Luteitalea sp.]|nr:DUF4115 domain-containing protein [Luteitalea sp.]